MVLAAIIGVLGYAGGLFVSAVIDLPSGAVIVWCIAISAIVVRIVFRQNSSQAG
jgi:zinc/manganese transport system permease protein